MDHYNRGGHTKYSLKVHLIFVTKYRRKVFLPREMAEKVKLLIYEASVKYGYNIIQMETDVDHIHILLEYDAAISVSEIAKQLKQYSTYHMWKYHYRILSKYYWKRKILRSDGYFTCSIGEVSQNIIEKYIQNQG